MLTKLHVYFIFEAKVIVSATVIGPTTATVQLLLAANIALLVLTEHIVYNIL
jgi:hypothetical protein